MMVGFKVEIQDGGMTIPYIFVNLVNLKGFGNSMIQFIVSGII